ncbi:MAG: S9 family peptidase, partial [Chloroflexi bacterium]|nr:S9 family peptidase [Chloroflexota bacterium]
MSETFDFDRFVTLPRLSDLRCSPVGSRLVVTVGVPAPDGKKLVNSLWEVDPDGRREPRRLTRSASGEGSPAFLPDGSLLFASARPDPDATDDAKRETQALWLLPADGGEARQLLAPEGGIEDIRAARSARTVVMAGRMHRDAGTLDADAARAKARKDAGVSALLFESYPIRHWDHYVGPRERHLLSARIPEGTEPAADVRDLTPDAGAALEERGFDVSPDGRTVVASMLSDDIRRPVVNLVAIDVETGRTRTLSGGDASYDQPAVSPDGRSVACVRTSLGDPETAEEGRLWLVELESGLGRDLAPTADLWPDSPTWAPDGSAVFFLAARRGSEGVFRA